MIERVAAALRAGGMEPSWEDIADAIWLAGEIARREASQPQPDEQASRGQPADEAGGTPPPASRPGLTGPRSQAPSRARVDSPSRPQTGEERAGAGEQGSAPVATLHTPPAPGTLGLRQARPFQTPAAAALPGALVVARALRPLMRRVPSTFSLVLDEEATAERAAEERIWVPVERPALVRWLDLALVVDQSPSMAVWSRTVEELRRLLERHGAFRDVRLWLLETDAPDGQAVLYAGTRSRTSRARPCPPRELIDPGQRRLILVISDCIARAWSSGAVQALLALWGQAEPVALVHMLPQRLWRYTAIETERVELRAPSPGAPNTRLEVTSWWSSLERELEAALAAGGEGTGAGVDQTPLTATRPIPVPVVALEARWLAPWASLVAGAGGRQVPGVVTWVTPKTGEPPAMPEAAEPEAPPPVLTADERVRRFRAVASPTAFELACYLAAAGPLTLPVMRLVQQAMLPGSSQVHLAEVLLGGLLERRTPAGEDVHPDRVEYDFAGGVRQHLRDMVPGSDTLRVLFAVGDFVGRLAGRTGTFPSVLLAPDGEEIASAEERAFAIVAAETLGRFGGPHAELGRRLEEKAGAAASPEELRAMLGQAEASLRELLARDRWRPSDVEQVRRQLSLIIRCLRLLPIPEPPSSVLEVATSLMTRVLADDKPARSRPPALLNELGVLLYLGGDLPSARSLFGQASRPEQARSPRDREATGKAANNLGLLHERSARMGSVLARGREEELAIGAYRRAIATRHPEQAPKAAVRLARLLTGRESEVERIVAAYRFAIRSGHAEWAPLAANNLGALHHQRWNWREARDNYRIAIDSRHPQWAPMAAANLAEYLEQEWYGRRRPKILEAAERYYRVAIQSGHPSQAPRAAFQLGRLLEAAGEREQAVEAYRLAAASGQAPWSSSADRRLRRLGAGSESRKIAA